MVYSACKKTPTTKLSKFLKTRSLLVVNYCFKNENNAVFGVFLQKLYRKILFALIISLVSTNLIFAQDSDETLHLRYDVFQEIGFSTEFNMGSFLNNDLIFNYYNGGFIDDTQKNENIDRLNTSSNLFGTSLITKLKYRKLPETMFYKHNMGFSFGIQQNYYQELSFTQDAFNLVFNGNKMFIGKSADLSNMEFGNLNYYQLKAGLFWQNRDKYLEYGFQFSLNLGNQFQNFNSSQAQLFTDSLGKNIQLNGNFYYRKTSYLGKNYNKIQGIGAGVDLYFQKFKKQDYLLRIELNNLGFIGWNNESLNYNKSENIDFAGVEVANIFQMPSPLISTTAKDTLNDYILANSLKGRYSSYTPADINIFMQYFLNEKFSSSAIFNYRIFSVYKPFYQLGIRYHFSDNIFIGSNLNYGGYTKFNVGLDFQIEIKHNFVLKLQSRSLSGFLVKQFSGIGAFLEITYKL